MPHFRNRHIKPLIQSGLGLSSIVGLIGHRQAGKTTLLGGFSTSYVTFDSSADLSSAQSDPLGFIKSRREPFGIDECQLCPELFPALKEAVRIDKKRGRFLLSGSVRFSSRKAIQESLTGRIINYELLPFTLSESHSLKLPSKLKKLSNSFSTKKLNESSLTQLMKTKHPLPWIRNEFTKTLVLGGLPGICFIRNQAQRNRLFSTHIETILNRDLRLIVETTLPLSTLKMLVSILAQRQGVPLEWAQLRAESGIGIPTLKRLMSAFESLFLLRILRTEGGPSRPIYFFEDLGLARYLSNTPGAPYLELCRGLYFHLREQWMYDDSFPADIYQFRTRSGALVPLCLSIDGLQMGILPILEHHATSDKVKTAKAFLNTFPNSLVVLAHSGSEIRMMTDRIFSIPWASLLV